jgi:hypothetical protein
METLTVDSILPKIAQLQQALETEAPGIETYLQEINEELRTHPELTFMLSDEQIQPIYAAILKRENVAITVKQAKKKGKNDKLDDGRSVADLL